MNTSKFHKLAGIFEILLSAFWSYRNAEIFYQYRAHPELLRPFLIPDWFLFLHFSLGLFGVYCGIQVFQSRWTLKKAYGLFFGLLLLLEATLLLSDLFL